MAFVNLYSGNNLLKDFPSLTNGFRFTLGNGYCFCTDLSKWSFIFNGEDISKRTTIYVIDNKKVCVKINNSQELKILDNEDASSIEFNIPIINEITNEITINKKLHKINKLLKSYSTIQNLFFKNDDPEITAENGLEIFYKSINENSISNSDLSYLEVTNDNKYANLLVYDGKIFETPGTTVVTSILPVSLDIDGKIIGINDVICNIDSYNNVTLNTLMGAIKKIKIIRKSDSKVFYANPNDPRWYYDIVYKIKNSDGSYIDVKKDGNNLNKIDGYVYAAYHLWFNDFCNAISEDGNEAFCSDSTKSIDCKIYLCLE